MWFQQWHHHHIPFHQGPLGCTQYHRKGPPRPYWRLSNWWRSWMQYNRLQLPVTPTVNMMSNHDKCFVAAKKVILATTAPMHTVIIVTVLVIFPRTAQRKSIFHIHHDRSHSHSHHDCNCRDRSQSSNYQRHTSHSLSCHCSSSWYPSTDRHSRWHSHWDTHTVATKMHPQPDTLHARSTLTTTPWTTAGPAQGTLMILPADHIHGRHQSHIHRQQFPHRPQHQKKVTIQDLHWTLPLNWVMTQML